MATFQTTRKILFQHCDPAGIVFYPRYFEMLNGAVEEWFEVGLGVSFADLHSVRRCGIPTVSLETQFRRPSRLGETVTLRYSVQKLGGASVTMRFAILGEDGEIKMDGSQVLVHTDLEALKPRPFPDDLRSAIARFTDDEEHVDA